MSLTTEDNVVTAVGPSGFYVQTPVARTDGGSRSSVLDELSTQSAFESYRSTI